MVYTPTETGQDGSRFHRTTQSGVQIKSDKLLTFRILHLVFQTVVDPWLTETTERVIADTGELLYMFCYSFVFK